MLGDSQQQPVTGGGEAPEDPPSLSDGRKGALGCAAILLGLAVLELLGVLVWSVWNPFGVEWWPWLVVIGWASSVVLAGLAAIIAAAAVLWPWVK